MVEIKTQYPYIDFEGKEKTNLVKTFAEDETGKKYYIKQLQTGIEYQEAVDVYPSRYTYVATNKPVEENTEK